MNKKKKKFLPPWMRKRVSCPDCGFLLQNTDYGRYISKTKDCYFICQRCGARYSEIDFWEEIYDKWSYKIREENYEQND